MAFMKTIKISLLLLILSISISCEKDEEPNSLAQDLQNGFWEYDNDQVLKFDGMNVTFYTICDYDGCSPNFPCIINTETMDYTLEGDILTIPDIQETHPIKIQDNILTLSGDSYIFMRKSTLGYLDC